MFLIVAEILYRYQLLKEVSSFLIVGVETYSLPKEWFGICIKMFVVHTLTQHSLFSGLPKGGNLTNNEGLWEFNQNTIIMSKNYIFVHQ